MLKKILEKLKGKEPQPPQPEAPKPEVPQPETPKPETPQPDPRFQLGNGFYFAFDEVSNGYGGYRMINVYLLKIDNPSFRRCIVDGSGAIQNFPGIRGGDWERGAEYPVDGKTRFRFWIGSYHEGKARVTWTVQPDGRYFEDESGFGGEDCEELTLYSYLDENGRFTEPFAPRDK